MHDYVVQAGDSPAQIAIKFAGCPKCTADLVAANPQKMSVRYPNGFVTFRDLSVGEKLHLPDKWFDGTLDALPKSYFDALPSTPVGVAGPPPPPPPPTTPPDYSAGIPVPAGPSNVSTADFMPNEAYTLTVWPIPNGPFLPSDPGAVLTNRGFDVLSIAANPDGSYTATVKYNGATDFVPDPALGLNVLVFTAGAMDLQFAPGQVVSANMPGTNVTVHPPSGQQWVSVLAVPGACSSSVPTDCLNNAGPGATPVPLGGATAGVPLSVQPGAATTIIATTKNLAPPPPGQPAPPPTVSVFVVTSLGAIGPAGLFKTGEVVAGDSSGVQATVASEYDVQGTTDGTLFVSGAIDMFMIGETVRGQSSGMSAVVKYQYPVVISDPNAGMIGVTSISDMGATNVMPYNAQPGDSLILTVRAKLNPLTSTLSDVIAMFQGLGLQQTPGAPSPMQNADCSWTLYMTVGPAPVVLDTQTTDAQGNQAWVTGLSANGNVIAAPQPPPPPMPSPTLGSCHAFTLTFVTGLCNAGTTSSGSFDPTGGALASMGLTNLSPITSGPDELGQWTVQGVWEGPDGAQLPQSSAVMVTGFTDDGPAHGVQQGPCAGGLPITLQPGDQVDMVVRPMGQPGGGPMANPAAILLALGFTNVQPSTGYADCTWEITATYTGGQSSIPGSPAGQPLNLTDPLVDPAGAGSMWIVALRVNGNPIKNPIVQQPPPVALNLVSCHSYTVLFTYATCAPLTGGPGAWDPTSALASLLPGFTLAQGPNEYGEWSATGTWTGADTTTPLQGSGGITFTGFVDYGPAQGCTAACPSGMVKDTVTGNCGVPCPGGGAPANGKCSTPTTPTAPSPSSSSTSSTGTAVAVGAGVIVVGGLAYLLFA